MDNENILYLLDGDFRTQVDQIDVYDSMIWTNAMWEAGEFELVLPATETNVNKINSAPYLQWERIGEYAFMVIEDIKIKTDIERGPSLIVTGRCPKSLVDRRVVMDTTAVYPDPVSLTELMLYVYLYDITGPTDPDRGFSPGWRQPSFPGNWFADHHTSYVPYGKNILDIYVEITKYFQVGWKIELEHSYILPQIVGYNGVDRSFNQSTNPYVTFSEANHNLSSSEYFKSEKPHKTFALVFGETGVGNIPTITSVSASSGGLTGWDRKETVIKSSVTRNNPVGTDAYTEAEYLVALQEDAQKELDKMVPTNVFIGDVDTGLYSFGTDYDLGDIVQIIDSFGNEAAMRVITVTHIKDIDGYRVNPILGATT